MTREDDLSTRMDALSKEVADLHVRVTHDYVELQGEMSLFNQLYAKPVELKIQGVDEAIREMDKVVGVLEKETFARIEVLERRLIDQIRSLERSSYQMEKLLSDKSSRLESSIKTLDFAIKLLIAIFTAGGILLAYL